MTSEFPPRVRARKRDDYMLVAEILHRWHQTHPAGVNEIDFFWLELIERFATKSEFFARHHFAEKLGQDIHEHRETGVPLVCPVCRSAVVMP
jgi:hypothetical protein